MFAIRVDEAAGILHLKLSGFWTLDTVQAFIAALVPAVRQIQRTHEAYSILSDSTDFPVQSAEVGAGFTRLMEAGAARTRGRTAIVVAGALNKLQAQRVFKSPNIGIFLTEEEALVWLAATPPSAGGG